MADRLVVATGRVAEVLEDRGVADAVSALGDDALLAVLDDAVAAQKVLDLVIAAASAETTRRSARELGYEGLAQKRGHRTGTSLIQSITGKTRADVTRAVQTGEDLVPATMPTAEPTDADSDAAIPATPEWLRLLRDALTSSRLSQAQFQALRSGLGEPPVERYPELDPGFLPAAWAAAVAVLLEESEDSAPEVLRAQAMIARDRLDPIGVTLRFEERFARRSFRTWIDAEGQRHGHLVFDDEAGAWVDAMVRAALRPRRGPRFVAAGPAPEGSADADERTNEQLQYDTIVAVLRTGANADPRQAFGDRQPGVRILVESSAITAAGERGRMRVHGVGHVEDGGQVLPGGVVEKYLCDAGAITATFDAFGRPLDLGREQRLFSRKQRIAIGLREGGCIGEHCDRPLSECEYHHIDHWCEHHGRTDVDDGVPLCRYCHLKLHNTGQRISRERDPLTGRDTYWLHKPPDPATGEVPPPVRLRSRSPLRFAAA